jgi:hypothetical protein
MGIIRECFRLRFASSVFKKSKQLDHIFFIHDDYLLNDMKITSGFERLYVKKTISIPHIELNVYFLYIIGMLKYIHINHNAIVL